MTNVVTDETVVETPDTGVVGLDELDQQLVVQLADRARSQRLRLTGEDGLLAQLTKTIIESAAEGEMDDHLGYAKYDRPAAMAATPAMAPALHQAAADRRRAKKVERCLMQFVEGRGDGSATVQEAK